jgi:mannose-6-phosphate isomerase-like protein (cupin superfamily)
MQIHHLKNASESFRILETTSRSQQAVMVLAPGECSSEQPSVHPESDQVFILLEGTVRAEVWNESATLRDGDALVVPAGAPHRFLNIGTTSARTFSVYTPPAYPD